MLEVFHFVSEYFYVYIWWVFTTFINILAPLPGSTVNNPVTAFFTDPQRAIGIGAFIFAITGIQRVYLFRKGIFSNRENVELIKVMLPYSVFGAVIGGYFISYINAKILVLLIIAMSLFFISKTLKQIIYKGKEINKTGKFSQISTSLISGFLQGSGMPGSDIRNNYLRTIVPETSVRGITSVIGVFNLFLAGSIIYMHNKLTSNDILFVLSVTPILFIVQSYGKSVLEKIDDNHAKTLAIILSIFGTSLLVYKYIL